MSDGNRNHVENHVGELTIPGRNGGRLRNGGTNRGGGRTPSIIREGLRVNILASAKRMRDQCKRISDLIDKRLAQLGNAYEMSSAMMDDLEKLNRAEQRLADFRAKYGLGTTVTETDTQGKDVIRVVREPLVRSEN